MSEDFYSRLEPIAENLAAHYQTPFHVYDEKGIRETGAAMITAFSGIEKFREYYAVKALPNPSVLKIMKEMGFGFDCSSIPELMLSRQIGAGGEDIMFTSNNTSGEEFVESMKGQGCILNLDDISLVDKLPEIPELICFRYNPGERRTGNSIIGTPTEAKYGVSHDQLVTAYKKAREKGAKRFGLHSMLASNECDYTYMVETAKMLLNEVKAISDALDIRFEFINIGGGLGIPYLPGKNPLDIISMGKEITALFHDFKHQRGYMPALFIESGRYMTGPHGVLVTKAINRKDIYRTYIGVDASMSALMRPGLYNAYHHITVVGKETAPTDTVVDVVGSLCENNDKFAIQRNLPAIADGDILLIHDTGAHGHAMGFNYNGRLRPSEIMLNQDGSASLIRRKETVQDYFATLEFPEDNWKADSDM
jgi:diaminopimelate decarboxylase